MTRTLCILLASLLTGPALAQDSGSVIDAPQGEAERPLTWRAPARDVTGNPLTDLAGHRVHWGVASRAYTENADVPGGTPGAVGQHTAEVAVEGQPGDVVTLYFAVTAYDASGNESAYSNEITQSFRIVDTAAPEPPTELQWGVQLTFVNPQGYGLEPVGE